MPSRHLRLPACQAIKPCIIGKTVLFISLSTAAPSTFIATSAEPKLAPKTPRPTAKSKGDVSQSARLNIIIPINAQDIVTRMTLRVPKRFTNHAEQRIPLIEPIDRPKRTPPISAIETERISRIAGVRVAQTPLTGLAKEEHKQRPGSAFQCIT